MNQQIDWSIGFIPFITSRIEKMHTYNIKMYSNIISLPKKGNAKECSNYHTIVFISHTSKVLFKILQVRLQQYVNQELLDV